MKNIENVSVENINMQIFMLQHAEKISQICDGHHTFKELYDFRMMYNVVLFNEWGKDTKINPAWAKNDSGKEPVELPKYDVHKSWRHHDGELCFGGGGWFIVVAMLPTGQITNHYKAEHWEKFKIPIADKAKYEYDGHTPEDVLKRLKDL